MLLLSITDSNTKTSKFNEFVQVVQRERKCQKNTFEMNMIKIDNKYSHGLNIYRMVILIERKGRLMTCVVHKDRHKRKHKISFWLMLSNLEIINTRTTTINAENTHSSISKQYNTQPLNKKIKE